MDSGSDTSYSSSIARRQDLQALERELLDNLAALRLRVTRLEFRLGPVSIRGVYLTASFCLRLLHVFGRFAQVATQLIHHAERE